ncbi:MAG: sulfotransferase [Phycisphaerales bacterium]
MSRVKVVFITSLGHSGSTLLDLLISAHSRIFSVGEVINVRNYAHCLKEKNERSKFGNECTCGVETIWACPFWTQVEAVMQSRFDRSLKDLDFRDYDAPDWGEQNRALYESVAEASGCDTIVDSSKAPKRLEKLIEADVVDISPIHLIRPARAYVYSKIRRKEDPLFCSLHFTRRTWQIRKILRSRPHEVCRYERLTSQPEQVMREVMKFIELDFEPEQMQWAGRERHNLGGNGMRRSTDSTIRPDLAWREELSLHHRLLIDGLTFPTRLMLPK